ncbi:hypothetical protein ABZX77_29890 [Streptomyces sp. NPDC004237]
MDTPEPAGHADRVVADLGPVMVFLASPGGRFRDDATRGNE